MGQPKKEIYTLAYNLYLEGYSLSGVAKKIKVTRQCVFKAFMRRGYELRKINKRPEQWYDGKKFTLRNHGYFELTTSPRTLLHRYIWSKERGDIPDGWDIHHINNNKLDNRIDNYECLKKSEHTKLHAKERGLLKCK